LGKKAGEKSGDLIMKRLGNMRQKTPAKKQHFQRKKKKVPI